MDRPLYDLLPEDDEPDADALLGRFLDYAADKGLTLYPAQEEALLELFEGRNVILNTPTGSGKSLVASGLHFASLAHGRRLVYTCPIKAFVNEKWMALCRELGRLRALAISSATRRPQLPDVPIFIELGYPKIQEYTCVGFFAPAGTPAEIVQKLNDAINAVLRMPDIRERPESLTLEPVGGSPQQFSDYVRAEVVNWGVVVKEIGAKVD
jgi:hypothetical protein